METLQLLKSRLAVESMMALRKGDAPKEIRIVAEGDSWFDYPFVLDVIDHLRKKGYKIFKKSQAGDTLENMVYGNDHKLKNHKAINLGRLDLEDTLKSVREYDPRFVLFSAGGNDVVGSEMVFYLNHKRSKKDLLRSNLMNFIMNEVVKPSILDFCNEVWDINPEIDILMDGYDYAKANGTSYLGISGPWILPNFGRKAILDDDEQKTIIKTLVDAFNGVLENIQQQNPKFHYINLRGMFPYEEQWHNEIHLRSEGYEQVAGKYHERINTILNFDPLVA